MNQIFVFLLFFCPCYSEVKPEDHTSAELNCGRRTYVSKALNPDGSCVSCPVNWTFCAHEASELDIKQCEEACGKPALVPTPTATATPISLYSSPETTSSATQFPVTSNPTVQDPKLTSKTLSTTADHSIAKKKTTNGDQNNDELWIYILVGFVGIGLTTVIAVLFFLRRKIRRKPDGCNGEEGAVYPPIRSLSIDSVNSKTGIVPPIPEPSSRCSSSMRLETTSL